MKKNIIKISYNNKMDEEYYLFILGDFKQYEFTESFTMDYDDIILNWVKCNLEGINCCYYLQPIYRHQIVYNHTRRFFERKGIKYLLTEKVGKRVQIPMGDIII